MTKAAAATITTYFKLLKIKAFLLLILFCFITLADLATMKMTEEEDLDIELRTIRRNCIKSSNVTDDQAFLINKNKLFTKNSTSENTPRELQCYCACFLDEFRIFVDGKPHEEPLRKYLPLFINDKKKANAVANKCVILKGRDKCEKAFNFELCIAKMTSMSMC